jgi:hypothetical protein
VVLWIGLASRLLCICSNYSNIRLVVQSTGEYVWLLIINSNQIPGSQICKRRFQISRVPATMERGPRRVPRGSLHDYLKRNHFNLSERQKSDIVSWYK